MISPVQLVTSIFSLNNMPLRIPAESMRHLYPIYNRPSKKILLRFARQTHKSTTVGYKISLPCIKYSNFHSLYVAPTGNQVSVFSDDKLNSALKNSEIIRDNFFDTQTKDQVSYKELRNGSKIYLRSAFHTADSSRGITADMSCIDEVQDIISDHIPVIEQCKSHSLAKWEHLKERVPHLPMHLFNSSMYAGTPKTVENTMEKYWTQSTQNEWIIKCSNQGCKKYNYINEENIGATCLICNKCGKPIYYENGQWISMNKSGFIEGYRLPQIILNWVNNKNNPEAWKTNVIETRKIYPTEKFFNEVLAIAYANARHPLSVADIKNACGDYDPIEEDRAFKHPMLDSGIITAGIDWGKGDTASGTSYTLLTISVWYKAKHHVVYKKRYTGRMSDAVLQIDDILRIMAKFKVVFTVADTGDGRTSNAILVNKLGAHRFAEIYEHGTIGQKIKWDGERGHYIMNRTRMMTDIIMEIKRKQVVFFKYDQFKDYQADFTGIYSEYSEQTRMTRYDHNVPDDAFHSYMFSRIAMMIKRGELSKYLSGGE